MSELQISLLIIGAVVVVVMYVYGWWQQRRYRKKFGATFNAGRKDALYSAAKETPPVAEEDAAEIDFSEPSVSREASAATEPEEVCELDMTINFVSVLTLAEPVAAEVLQPLWQRRFDFGKLVSACGLKDEGAIWEKLSPESNASYAAFKLGLQLADRAGPVSEVHLSDFQNLVREIAQKLEVAAELPNVAAIVARATQLDSFCAEVDQMIGLNILPGGDRKFAGSEVEQVADRYDMILQADGSFHLEDAHGNGVFTLSSFDGTPFQSDSMDKMRVSGLTLLLDVPRAEHPARRFDEMAVLARKIAMDLRAAVMDDHRVALGEPGIAQIRELVGGIESRMLDNKVVPGSVQARRLFS